MKGSKTRIVKHKSLCKMKFTLKPLLSGSMCSETTVHKVESDGKLNTVSILKEVDNGNDQSTGSQQES